MIDKIMEIIFILIPLASHSTLLFILHSSSLFSLFSKNFFFYFLGISLHALCPPQGTLIPLPRIESPFLTQCLINPCPLSISYFDPTIFKLLEIVQLSSPLNLCQHFSIVGHNPHLLTMIY